MKSEVHCLSLQVCWKNSQAQVESTLSYPASSDIVTQFLVAGHETTAATLGFLLAELAHNPECMAKSVKEIGNILGDRSSPNYEDISKLTYINACLKEALRMNPPVQSLRRECAHNTIVFGNTLLF